MRGKELYETSPKYFKGDWNGPLCPGISVVLNAVAKRRNRYWHDARCSRLCAGLLVVAWLPVAEPEGQLAADSGSCGIGLLLDFVGVAISLY